MIARTRHAPAALPHTTPACAALLPAPAESFSLGAAPTTKDAQGVADEIFSSFISSDVDKVELVYTKFVSLITSNPTIQTLLPMTPMGELCDVDGKCVDAAEDEIFKLTSKGGQVGGAGRGGWGVFWAFRSRGMGASLGMHEVGMARKELCWRDHCLAAARVVRSLARKR